MSVTQKGWLPLEFQSGLKSFFSLYKVNGFRINSSQELMKQKKSREKNSSKISRKSRPEQID